MRRVLIGHSSELSLEKLLKERSRCVSWERFPIEDGIGPETLQNQRSRTLKDLRFPIEFGNCLRSLPEWNSGREPVRNSLDDKSIA